MLYTVENMTKHSSFTKNKTPVKTDRGFKVCKYFYTLRFLTTLMVITNAAIATTSEPTMIIKKNISSDNPPKLKFTSGGSMPILMPNG